MFSSRRVVVTGIGMVTPLGLTTETTWNNLINSHSGITSIDAFNDYVDLPNIAGLVKGFTLGKFKTQQISKADQFVQYGLQAAKEAILDAKIIENDINLDRVGVSIGSGLGGLHAFEKQHQKLLHAAQAQKSILRMISPFFMPGSLMNMTSGLCAMEYGFQGPNFSVNSACATGAHNIMIGSQYILSGDAEIMIVGGSEMATTPLAFAGFAACRALSTRHLDATASRPWDRDRDGFVLSDGAAVLVLEEYEHAIRRGAKIYGEILGAGMSADAYHVTLPDPKGTGAIKSMKTALNKASILPSQVDYINAHATSTKRGDSIEIDAIRSIWKKSIDKLMISATKSSTGHLLGAAGSLEAAFCLLAIQHQVIPPTLNLEHADKACADLNLVPGRAQTYPVQMALSNSFGFGGVNVSLLFGKIG